MVHAFPSRFLHSLIVAVLLAVPRLESAETASAVHTIYLIRHGVYFDGGRPAEPNADKPLTPLGREQAQLTANRLAALPFKFDSIVTSEMVRAKETGDIIAAKLGLKTARDSQLNESIPPGVGLAERKIATIPGATEQFEMAWARYFKPTPDAPHRDLLVCHGALIRWLACKVLGTDLSLWTRLTLSNCALTVIQIQPDGTGQLVLINDASHLPLEKQTTYFNVPVWPELQPSPPK